MLQESLPPQIFKSLEELGLNGSPPLLTTVTDLSVHGDLERHWLVVNQQSLAVLTDGPAPRAVMSLAISEVEGFRSQGVIGSGYLQARVAGVWVDVLRYSNSLSNRFATVAAKL